MSKKKISCFENVICLPSLTTLYIGEKCIEAILNESSNLRRVFALESLTKYLIDRTNNTVLQGSKGIRQWPLN